MNDEFPYIVQTKSTDGIGGWSKWADVALFKYKQNATSYAAFVSSYQHEEAAIDRVKIRVVTVKGEVIS